MNAMPGVRSRGGSEGGDRAPGKVLHNFADTRKAAAMLDWSAQVSLPEGVRRTVRCAAQAGKELPVVS
jgi:nucleoside-diphosphate-sugar epimerase